jgi:hypothetical protein
MAYLVIAIGGLLSLVGIFAIASGFPVIEVERGWAEVISGSTMLAGGLLIVAIGLVLRTLLAIQRALTARPATGLAVAPPPSLSSDGAATPGALDHAPALAGPPTMAAPLAPEPFAAEPSKELASHAHDISLEPGMALEVPHTALASYEPIDNPHLPVDQSAHEPPDEDPGIPDPVVVEDAPHQAEVVTPPQHETSPHPAHDGYELQTPSTPDHDLAPLAPAPAASDDWLDRAFSALDEEISAGQRPKEPAVPSRAPVLAERAAAPIKPAHGDTMEAEPLPLEQPSVTPPPPAPVETPADSPVSAVIGRYESDGTSYVMYADGSIEAQSEAGIYRFRSMAELKAFIEG